MWDTIFLYLPFQNNRLDYTVNLIFIELLGFENIIVTQDLMYWNNIEGKIKIAYTPELMEQGLWIPQTTSLLCETELRSLELCVNWDKELPYAFQDEKSIANSAMFNFDLYAWIFYLVSRYEEYLPFKADRHQRFSAKVSLAYKKAFLHLPVINLWIACLRLKIRAAYPKAKIPPISSFVYQASYDIDYAWMYKHKGWKRQLGGVIKDLLKGRLTRIKQRIAILNNSERDPYYTFDYLNNLHQQYPQTKPVYFWLLGDYGSYDKNINAKHTAMQHLIQRHQALYDIGIHPSYASNESIEQLSKEIKRLEAITAQKILISRQHFLRLHFPTTYRSLLNLGINADYSMGYADAVGFRASIATPFFWYDLEREVTTTMRIHPFMFMDVTLKNYLNLDKEQVFETILPIILKTKEVGGHLMSIWHNNSFCEQDGWEGWRVVYEKILHFISESDV